VRPGCDGFRMPTNLSVPPAGAEDPAELIVQELDKVAFGDGRRGPSRLGIL
jgi:hypothetical protein